jgi:hypothetical protein
MPIMDLVLLSEYKLACLDEAGNVDILGISLRGHSPLTAAESRQFQLFLARQELRLLACSGGTPLHRHVKVWRPQDAWYAQLPADRGCRVAIERHLGRLAPFGSLEENRWWHAGLAHDEHSIVIVPAPLLILRRREVLFQLVEKERAQQGQDTEDLFTLARAIALVEQSHRPDTGASVPLMEEVECEITDVSWWLSFAGPEPTGYDSHDARRVGGHEHDAH